MTIENAISLVKELGALGIVAMIILLGFKFLDKYAGKFGTALDSIVAASAQHSKEASERHQITLAALKSEEKASAEDFTAKLNELRKAMDEGLKEIRGFTANVRKFSPGEFPAVRDTRRDR